MNRYIALDVETIGLSPKNGDRVIEIGAVAIENQSIIAEFSSLIDVDKRIPWQVQQAHGITNEMLSGERKPDEALQGIRLKKLKRAIIEQFGDEMDFITETRSLPMSKPEVSTLLTKDFFL